VKKLLFLSLLFIFNFQLLSSESAIIEMQSLISSKGSSSGWISLKEFDSRDSSKKITKKIKNKENHTSVTFELEGFELKKPYADSYAIRSLSTKTAKRNDQPFIKLEVPGTGNDSQKQIGAPSLPFRGTFFEIPENNHVDIDIINKETVSLGYGYNIFPQQPPIINSLDEEPEFRIDIDAYNENKFYPEHIVKIEKIGFVRGRKVAFVSFNPFQYNPVTGELISHKNIEFDLVYYPNRSDSEKKNRESLYSDIFENSTKKLIANYKEPKKNVRSYESNGKELDGESGAQYLIITGDDFSNQIVISHLIKMPLEFIASNIKSIGNG